MSFLRAPRGGGNGRRRTPLSGLARGALSPEDEPVRRLLAREWGWVSGTSLLVALLAGLHAASGNPRWERGDLIVGLYFATISLIHWVRAVWIGSGRAVMPSVRGYAIALATTFGIGVGLVIADVLSVGRL